MGFSFFDGPPTSCICWTDDPADGDSAIFTTDGVYGTTISDCGSIVGEGCGYTYCYGCLELRPSTQPSMQPSVSGVPSSQPSESPSISTVPSSMPSESPSVSAIPSSQPSENPSVSHWPTSQPSENPSISGQPSSIPSESPSVSTNPSSQPSMQPSISGVPSSQPSESPSISTVPSSQPSSSPSQSPSSQPSLGPSSQPSSQPSFQPSSQPSQQPSCTPSSAPTNPDTMFLFYPDWSPNGSGCNNDGKQPNYMTKNPSDYLFSTLDRCCSTYFNWNYDTCMGLLPGECARELYYPDWSGSNEKCIADGNEPQYSKY